MNAARTRKMMPSDDGVALTLIEQTHDAMMEMSRSLHGNGGEGVLTRLSHVERSIKELAPDNKMRQVRWRVIGEIAMALAVIVSLAMQFIQ